MPRLLDPLERSLRRWLPSLRQLPKNSAKPGQSLPDTNFVYQKEPTKSFAAKVVQWLICLPSPS